MSQRGTGGPRHGGFTHNYEDFVFCSEWDFWVNEGLRQRNDMIWQILKRLLWQLPWDYGEGRIRRKAENHIKDRHSNPSEKDMMHWTKTVSREVVRCGQILELKITESINDQNWYMRESRMITATGKMGLPFTEIMRNAREKIWGGGMLVAQLWTH